MTTIDGRQAVALLERVVAERGEDFVYQGVGMEESCQYAGLEGPSCGVGLALSYLGVPDSSLDIMDTCFYNKTAFNREEIQNYLSGSFGLEFDREAVIVLSRFQRNQDFGSKYSEALTSAKEEIV